MTDCRHHVITTYATEDDLHHMWACADCRIRFYPHNDAGRSTAAEDERARIAAAVRGLPAEELCYCEADRRVIPDDPDLLHVRLAAVLAMIEP